MNSTQLIGVVQSSWDNYKIRNHIRDDSQEMYNRVPWDNYITDHNRELYLAYYNGWLEGRMNMLFDESIEGKCEVVDSETEPDKNSKLKYYLF